MDTGGRVRRDGAWEKDPSNAYGNGAGPVEAFLKESSLGLEETIMEIGVEKMLIDMTLKITPKMVAEAQGNEKKAMLGHLGTHFDVMNKEFPLEFTEREGVVFDVTGVTERDIERRDINEDFIHPGIFVAFYSGFIDREGYGSRRYFAEHPQLSHELIDYLIERKVSLIGVDFAGVRRGKEHTPKDQYCADHGIFIVENLCNLQSVVKEGPEFIACTYPMNYTEMTGLPCRVVARIG